MRSPITLALPTSLLGTVLLLGAVLLSGAALQTGAPTAHVEPAARAKPAGEPAPASAALLSSTALSRGTPPPSGSMPGEAEPSERPSGAGQARPVTRLAWPLAGAAHLVRPFRPPSHEYGPGHRGADLAGERAQQVLAAGDGIVVYAGRLTDRELVSVEHPGGLRTTYEPVRPTVTAGQQVVTGQPLGTLQTGHPGCRAAPPSTCLHWGARREDRYLNPIGLVGSRLRLLPWDGARPSGEELEGAGHLRAPDIWPD